MDLCACQKWLEKYFTFHLKCIFNSTLSYLYTTLCCHVIVYTPVFSKTMSWGARIKQKVFTHVPTSVNYALSTQFHPISSFCRLVVMEQVWYPTHQKSAHNWNIWFMQINNNCLSLKNTVQSLTSFQKLRVNIFCLNAHS